MPHKFDCCGQHPEYNPFCFDCVTNVNAASARFLEPAPPPSERGAGLKFDSGKGRWSLMMQGCANALAGVVEVLGFGAKKYAAHSWKQVENGEERYRDALYRHLHALERGEEIDPESGLPHWDHVCCNALFLSEKFHTRG